MRCRLFEVDSRLQLVERSSRVIDFRFCSLPQFPFCHEQVVAHLQIHPKLRAVSKVSGKPKRRIRTNRSLSFQIGELRERAHRVVAGSSSTATGREVQVPEARPARYRELVAVLLIPDSRALYATRCVNASGVGARFHFDSNRISSCARSPSISLISSGGTTSPRPRSTYA